LAKRLDDEAVRMAVVVHVRHSETDYDKLPTQGLDRSDARREVRDRVASTVCSMRGAAFRRACAMPRLAKYLCLPRGRDTSTAGLPEFAYGLLSRARLVASRASSTLRPTKQPMS
jgi:hypothetical protein